MSVVIDFLQVIVSIFFHFLVVQMLNSAINPTFAVVYMLKEQDHLCFFNGVFMFIFLFLQACKGRSDLVHIKLVNKRFRFH